MAGLQSQLGVAPKQKKAISVPDLKKIVAKISDTLIRDRAILLLGFGAFRRSALVAVDVGIVP